MAGEKDSRVVVGGAVFARAEAISRDFKRILGNQFKTKWIEGVVVRAEKRKASDAAKRATTYVTGKYPCGKDATGQQEYKVRELPLQSVKDKDPSTLATSNNGSAVAPAVAPADAPAVATAAIVAPQDTTTVTTTENVQATEQPTTPDGEVNTTVLPPPPPDTAATGSTQTSNTSTSTASTKVPVTTANDRHWYDGDTKVDVNGKHSSRFWKVTDQYGRGHEFTPGCDRSKEPRFRPINYFMVCFPKTQLQEMEERTSEALVNAFPEPLPPTSIGELLKFFGILLIITRFEFGKRSSLWTETAHTRFVPPPNLGKTTGMSRNRFDQLWRYIVWSDRPSERPDNMSHEEWRWALIQDFVDNFNKHREEYFSPSWLLCADESISRWYGLGGTWINIGLPMYVAMDRKPEHGCEIQNCCDAMSGIMLRLKIVKSQAAEQAITAEQRTAAADAEST